MNDKIFAEGFFFEKPRDGAPEFVKGKLSISVERATNFLKANANEKGYVNLDLLKSKDGTKFYFQLNQWVPKDMQGKEEHLDFGETRGMSEEDYKKFL